MGRHFNLRRQTSDQCLFHFPPIEIEQPQIKCYIGYTTNEVTRSHSPEPARVAAVFRPNKGVGPRYCPSIEDKVVKFADKQRHQLFLEPEGHDTNEVYLNGFSTSLPAGMQQDSSE